MKAGVWGQLRPQTAPPPKKTCETRFATRPRFVANVMHIVTDVAISAGICEKLTSGVGVAGVRRCRCRSVQKKKKKREERAFISAQPTVCSQPSLPLCRDRSAPATPFEFIRSDVGQWMYAAVRAHAHTHTRHGQRRSDKTKSSLALSYRNLKKNTASQRGTHTHTHSLLGTR